MKILSLDTSMAACSVAVIDTRDPQPLAADFVVMERGHAEALAPMVADVMGRSGLTFAQIDRLAVTTGPGTFTGVRIGLAFARGLGLARALPVIGIDSLSAIAANEPRGLPLLVACDARNGEVYAAAFDTDHRLTHAPHVTTIAAAADLLPHTGLVLGSAAEALNACTGGRLGRSAAGDLPMAACFGRLAEGMMATDMPSPLYLRAPDAKPQSQPLRKFGKLTITSVEPSAAELLAGLHGEIFDDGWSADAFAALLATPGTEALVTADDNDAMGLLVTRRAADEAEIITIGTRPSVQRRGVARRMLEHHLGGLGTAGVRRVFLEVAASNAAAQGLYGALGFREAGRRKAYYRRADGSAEDAIVMRRELGP